MTVNAVQPSREAGRTSSTSDVELGEYSRIAHRQRWTILLTILVFTGLAAVYAFLAPSSYSASTTVLLQPGVTDITSTAIQTVDVETQAQYAASSVVASRVRLPGNHSGSALLKNLKVAPGAGASTTLVFTYTDPNAETARRLSLAFAQAYLSQRRDTLEVSVQQAQARARQRVQHLRAQLTAAQSGPSTPGAQDTTSETLIANEIQDLRVSLNRFSLMTVDPGTVIDSPPPAGDLKVSPSRTTTLAAGLLLGLFAGLILAFVRDRGSKRIAWSPASQAAITPGVLEVIPGARRAMQQFSRTGEVSASSNAGAAMARASEYLRSRITTANALILVTSPETDDFTSMTATGLAENFAATGTPVTLITRASSSARGRDDRAAASATFRDVLDRQVEISEVGGTYHRSGFLRIIPFGALEPGTLRTAAAQDAIRILKKSTTALVVDAPPLMGGADALALSAEADFVLIVVANGVTRRDAFTTAADHVAGVTRGQVASIVVTK
jgi:capsular polysaccharide biosynthesis protein